jgi:APA family basic amino acid/polyamine antiporter
LILQAIWAILLLFSGTYSELLDYVIFASLLFYALTVASLIRLRFTKPELPRPFRVPFYPFLPIVYAMLCISLMLALLIVRPGFTWPGLLIVALGIPVYGMFRLMGGRDEAQARAGS